MSSILAGIVGSFINPLSSIKNLFIILAVVAALGAVGTMIYKYVHESDVVAEKSKEAAVATERVNVLTQDNANMQDGIAKNEESHTATDKSEVKIADAQSKTSSTFRQRRNTTAVEETKILENTELTPEQKVQQVSTARIDGLWKDYCNTVANDGQCASDTNPKNPPSTKVTQLSLDLNDFQSDLEPMTA